MSNTTHIFGKVMADPELRYTASGKAVVSLRVGDSRRFKDDEGNTQYENTYFNATCWEKTADFVNTHFRKGDWVSLSGQLASTIRIWEGSDGQPRASYELTRVHNIEKAWGVSNDLPENVEEEESVPF